MTLLIFLVIFKMVILFNNSIAVLLCFWYFTCSNAGWGTPLFFQEQLHFLAFDHTFRLFYQAVFVGLETFPPNFCGYQWGALEGFSRLETPGTYLKYLRKGTLRWSNPTVLHQTPISQVAIASTSHSSKLPSISAPRHGYGPPEASAPVPAARPPRPRRAAPPAAPQGAGGSSTAPTAPTAGRAMDLKNLVSDELRKVLEEDPDPPAVCFWRIFFGWFFSRFYTGNWSRSTGKDNHYHRICLP